MSVKLTAHKHIFKVELFVCQQRYFQYEKTSSSHGRLNIRKHFHLASENIK